MKIFVETDRIIMRELIAEDVHGMYDLDSDPEVHRYFGNTPISSLKEAADIILMVQKQYEENGIGRWAVIDKTTGDFIGWSGLKYETDMRTNTPNTLIWATAFVGNTGARASPPKLPSSH